MIKMHDRRTSTHSLSTDDTEGDLTVHRASSMPGLKMPGKGGYDRE